MPQVGGARVELARQGALDVLAGWLGARPVSELQRHAAAATRRLAGAGDGGAAGPRGPASGTGEDEEEDVFARGWLDARLTDRRCGLLAPLCGLCACDSSAARAHAVVAVAALAARPPNRRALAEAGGGDALLAALRICAADLDAPARRRAGTQPAAFILLGGGPNRRLQDAFGAGHVRGGRPKLQRGAGA